MKAISIHPLWKRMLDECVVWVVLDLTDVDGYSIVGIFTNPVLAQTEMEEHPYNSHMRIERLDLNMLTAEYLKQKLTHISSPGE